MPQIEDIVNVVLSTWEEAGEGSFVDIASTYQDYIMLDQLYRNNKQKFQGGKKITWRVRYTTSGNAANFVPYDTFDLNIRDTLVEAETNWKHVRTGLAMDDFEVEVNSGEYEIVDLVQERMSESFLDLADLLEEQGFKKPASSAVTDEINGLQYHIVYNATDGFTGSNPAGFTTWCNLDRDTYTGLKNYSATYTNVTKTDLIRKWRKASVLTKFRSPRDVKLPDFNTGDKWGWYTNYDVIGTLEEELEKQNDNLGNDVASKDGKTMFRQRPVNWVPFFENNTADPIYGVNWGWFKFITMKNRDMRKIGPRMAPRQPTVSESFWILTCNMICRNPREGGLVLAKSYPALAWS